MIFNYIDKITKRNIKLDTDAVTYISYYVENGRAILFGSNGFEAFTTNLGDLMLPMVTNGLDTYIYCMSNNQYHYLLNANEIKEYSLDGEITIVVFENAVRLIIDNRYAYQAIDNTMEKFGYEAKNSREVHTSSIGDS